MNLGKNQQRLLELLREHGDWYPGCGWTWGTYSETKRILDSLLRAGLVTRSSTGRYSLIEK